MAMRLYTQDEFENELICRGCEKITDETDGTGNYWRTEHGEVFQVPHPEEPGGKYPDWMLDHIILTHRLPAECLD